MRTSFSLAPQVFQTADNRYPDEATSGVRHCIFLLSQLHSVPSTAILRKELKRGVAAVHLVAVTDHSGRTPRAMAFSLRQAKPGKGDEMYSRNSKTFRGTLW